MIVIVTTKERDQRTGREELLASHGIDFDSGAMVTLPCETPESLGASFHVELAEWVIDAEGDAEKDERPRMSARQ